MTEPTLLLLDWEQYSRPPIFANLQNIHSFEAMLQFPQFASVGDEGLTKRLVDRLYQEVFAVSAEIGLGAFDQIDRFSRGGRRGLHEGVTYGNDPWEFTVEVSPDQTLRITRDGSSFKRFYEWYVALMPYFSRFADALTEEYEQVVNARAGSELKVIPARARFTFEFLLHDFKVPNANGRVKNTRLLQSALTRVPGPDGLLVTLDEKVLSQLGRVDLSISRWSNTAVGLVREVYEVQAPANRDYGALWVRLSYIGETSDSDTLPREAPDMAALIRRVDIPINDFLQKHALTNFLGTLSEGVSFSTTTGGLP